MPHDMSRETRHPRRRISYILAVPEAAGDLNYGAAALIHFRTPRHAGAFPTGTPGVVRGQAGPSPGGDVIRLELRIGADGTIAGEGWSLLDRDDDSGLYPPELASLTRPLPKQRAKPARSCKPEPPVVSGTSRTASGLSYPVECRQTKRGRRPASH